MEHRCGSRYKVDVELYLRTCGGAVCSTGRLSEVSVSGGFVRTALPVPPLAYITLQLTSDTSLYFEGHVIRRAPDGIGIEWSEYAPGMIQFLTQPRREARLRPEPLVALQQRG